MAGLKKKKPKTKTKVIKRKKVAIKKAVTKKKTLKKPIGKKSRNAKEPSQKRLGVVLKRAPNNPIIEPRSYPWESKATFNPAAFLAHGKINLVYRAIGDDDSSVLGYAGTHDGYNIIDRPTSFIFRRSNLSTKADSSISPIDYISGGGWNGGCEDPRLTRIGDFVYMIFTAFDGWGSVRLMLTSISLENFEKKRWHWKEPVMISPPGEIHKNWVIFPEKINGKFAILHSFYPNILIHYFDSFDEFDGKKFIKSNNTRPVDPARTWDSWFRGVGPTPIKTSLGWLIIYQAMDHRNPDRYRIGALILDYKNPTKVLYRSVSPVLEPEEYYENNGYKWGVVYSCGAVVKDGELFVYYGGADKVIGVATIKVERLLDDLKKYKVTKLTKQSVRI